MAVNLTISNPTATTCLLGPSLGLQVGRSYFGAAIAGIDAELAPGGSTTRAIADQMHLEPGTYPAVLSETRSSISFETVVTPAPPCTPAGIQINFTGSAMSNWYGIGATGIADPCSLTLSLTQIDFFDPTTGDLVGTDNGPFDVREETVGAQFDTGGYGCTNAICADYSSPNPFTTTINPADVIFRFDVNGSPLAVGPHSVITSSPES